MRVLDSGLRPARWNVAMTAALVELHAQGRSADTMRFHRYPASVLLGRSQDMEHAADTAYCRRRGIEVARRVTGGGAVFMSPRMLAWDVIVDRRALGKNLEAITRGICQGVASGLSRLGASARFRSPNDIETGGRKVSGSGGYVVGRSAVLQGTVLIADDLPQMARALRLSEAELRGRVTCLAAAIGQVPPVGDVAVAVRDGLMRALGRTPAMGQPSAEEMAVAESLLREEIGTDELVEDVCTKGLTA
jgi:lipoate-protein ligase A